MGSCVSLEDNGTNKIPNLLQEYTGTSELPDLLFRYNALVSGSVVLKALDPCAKWPLSDIDLYVHQEHAVAFETELRKHINLSKPWISLPELCSSEYDCLKVPGIVRVRTLKILNLKQRRSIQLMVIQSGHPLSGHIRKTFDISLLVNYYDGCKVTCVYPHHVTARCGVVLIPWHINLNKRIEKYTKRGYTIKWRN
tara:strand:- start:487 stop:1074 length:588 start_codon:yes stop_codon:yes gene_type:complete